MDLTRLATFLEAANKATYANRTMPKAPSSRAGSLDYHFEQDGLAYHDTYSAYAISSAPKSSTTAASRPGG